MPDDRESIPKLPVRRPPPPSQQMPDLSQPGAHGNVVPLKKPSAGKPAKPMTQALTKPVEMIAQRIEFPRHLVRTAKILPPMTHATDNVRPMTNGFWLEAFIRKVRLNLVPAQLMITQEKRLLLPDFSTS